MRTSVHSKHAQTGADNKPWCKFRSDRVRLIAPAIGLDAGTAETVRRTKEIGQAPCDLPRCLRPAQATLGGGVVTACQTVPMQGPTAHRKLWAQSRQGDLQQSRAAFWLSEPGSAVRYVFVFLADPEQPGKPGGIRRYIATI